MTGIGGTESGDASEIAEVGQPVEMAAVKEDIDESVRSQRVRPWWRGWLIAAGGMVLLVIAGVVIGVVMFSGSSGKYQIGLQVQLRDAASTEGLSNGQGCSGRGSFSFLNTSTEVTVSDPNGHLLDDQPLGPGVVFATTHCDFDLAFVLPNEPTYSFQVGKAQSVTFSSQRLKSDHWEAVMPSGTSDSGGGAARSFMAG